MNVPVRVVDVVGIGVFSPLGVGESEHVAALMARGGCTTVRAHSFLPLFGRVREFQPAAFIPNRKALRSLSRQALLGCSAAAAALCEAQWADAGLAECAISVGGSSWSGSVVTLKDAVEPALNDDGTIDYPTLCSTSFRNLPPQWVLPLLPNTTGGHISILNGLKGHNMTVVNGPASGMVAVGEAFKAIRAGRFANALCGGAEGPPPPDLAFNLQERGSLSREHTASKPTDDTGTGFFCGEAGVVFALALRASEPGAAVQIPTIRGYVNRYVPHMQDRDVEAIGRSYSRFMRGVLEEAGWSPGDVDFVQAAACGLAVIDRAEALAIRTVFGTRIPITSIHGQAGHCLSAAGPLSLACAIFQLKHGFIAGLPGTVGHVRQDVPSLRPRRALIDCFDHLGGACCVLVEIEEESA